MFKATAAVNRSREFDVDPHEFAKFEMVLSGGARIFVFFPFSSFIPDKINNNHKCQWTTKHRVWKSWTTRFVFDDRNVCFSIRF